MKKVKVTLAPGSVGKKFYLFPSAEALYLWTCALEKGETLSVPDIEELVLEPDGFMEVELRGFDYAWDGPNAWKRFDLVRLAMAQQPQNASGLLVTIHSGWVSSGLLPLRDYVDSTCQVCRIDASDAKIDIAALLNIEELFNDEMTEESIDIDMDDDGT